MNPNNIFCVLCKQTPQRVVESVCCTQIYCLNCVIKLNGNIACDFCKTKLTAKSFKKNDTLQSIIEKKVACSKCNLQIKESEMSNHQQNDCMAHLMPDHSHSNATTSNTTTKSAQQHPPQNGPLTTSSPTSQQQEPSEVRKDAVSTSDSGSSTTPKNPFAPVIDEVPQSNNTNQDLGSFISSNILTPNIVNQLENFKRTVLVLLSSFGFTVPDYLLETQGMSGAVKIAILLFLLFILKGPIFWVLKTGIFVFVLYAIYHYVWSLPHSKDPQTKPFILTGYAFLAFYLSVYLL